MSCYTGSANTGALAAQSAIDLNPSFALGHLVLGMARLFDGDADRAVAPLRYGLMLNPNDPQNVAWHILLAYAELLSDMLDRRSKAQTGRWRCVPCSVRHSRCCAAAQWRLDGAMMLADGPNA